MKNLISLIEHENAFALIFGGPVIDHTNLSQDNCQNLLDRVDGQLSPENLTCDGELRGAALMSKAKARHLNSARAELMNYAAKKHYTIVSTEDY